jgi:DNA-binding NarL/FixJ family response regulator
MNRTAPVRALIVDDHALVRAGLRACFASEPALEVVGEAASGREALAAMATMDPDLVVTDISMPDMDGFELIGELKQRFPRIRVLVLSMHDKPQFQQRARAQGADGYVSKGAAAALTLAAVAIVAAGGLYFPALSEPLPRDPLTAREREVLLLVAQGLQNKEIADKLAIGVKTVETHRLHAREKLGLGTAAQCRRYAEEQGWL